MSEWVACVAVAQSDKAEDIIMKSAVLSDIAVKNQTILDEANKRVEEANRMIDKSSRYRWKECARASLTRWAKAAHKWTKAAP